MGVGCGDVLISCMEKLQSRIDNYRYLSTVWELWGGLYTVYPCPILTKVVPCESGHWIGSPLVSVLLWNLERIIVELVRTDRRIPSVWIRTYPLYSFGIGLLQKLFVTTLPRYQRPPWCEVRKAGSGAQGEGRRRSEGEGRRDPEGQVRAEGQSVGAVRSSARGPCLAWRVGVLLLGSGVESRLAMSSLTKATCSGTRHTKSFPKVTLTPLTNSSTTRLELIHLQLFGARLRIENIHGPTAVVFHPGQRRALLKCNNVCYQ